MHGYGVLYYASGKPAYEGQWKGDKFNGRQIDNNLRGVLYNEESEILFDSFDFTDFNQLHDYWLKYDGLFEEDSKNGNF